MMNWLMLVLQVCWSVCWAGVSPKIIRSWSPPLLTLLSMLISMLRFLTSSLSMTRSSPSPCPCTSASCGRRAGSGRTTPSSPGSGILCPWSSSMISGYPTSSSTISRASLVYKCWRGWQVGTLPSKQKFACKCIIKLDFVIIQNRILKLNFILFIWIKVSDFNLNQFVLVI